MAHNYESCSSDDASHDSSKEQIAVSTKREFQSYENVKKRCSEKLGMMNEDDYHHKQEFSGSQSSQQIHNDCFPGCSSGVEEESQDSLIMQLESGNGAKNGIFSMIQAFSNCSNGVIKNESRRQDTLQKLDACKNIFNLALSNKCCDNFTEMQRKNIEMWKGEMDLANLAQTGGVKKEYDGDSKAKLNNNSKTNHENVELSNMGIESVIQDLLRENEALKHQLLGLQHTLSKSQNNSQEQIKKWNEGLDYSMQLVRNYKRILRLSGKTAEHEVDVKPTHYCNGSVEATVSNTEREVRLHGLISIYLRLWPKGTCIDTICSYLQQIVSNVDSSEIQNLMEKYPTVYREETSLDGTRCVKRWRFTGFES